MQRKKTCLIILGCVIQSVFLPLKAATGVLEDKTATWISPPPLQQLYAEGLDDQKGMARIFIPVITNPSNEPNFAVFQDEELVGEKPMGSSFFLPPGDYSILLGTGTLDQRIRKDVTVQRGETLILEPDWSALSIEVIDESRNFYKKDLQIYRSDTFESFGIIPAINPELGEQSQTLLLKPGLYKIVERGSDPNTFVNFSTVLLEEGTYTPYTLVINSQTDNFYGAGILTSAAALTQNKNWKLFSGVHGSVMLNSANDVSEEKSQINLSFLTQLENRLLFDRMPHYYLSNNLLEIGALRQENQKFLISQDRLQLKNTYVYYLLPWLGGYTRYEVKTHLFNTISRFEERRTIRMRDLNGEDTYYENVDQVKLEPAFFPLGMKEGLGVNWSALRTYQARLSLRTGFGFRQTYNRGVYKQSTIETLYERLPDNFVRGLEVSLISSLSLLRNLAVTTELDMLFPTGLGGTPVIDLENIFSIGLTRNAAIEYIFRLHRDPAFEWSVIEQFVSIRLSYFIF